MQRFIFFSENYFSGICQKIDILYMRATKKLYNKNTEEKRGKLSEVPLHP
jgi:hypothetical protein